MQFKDVDEPDSLGHCVSVCVCMCVRVCVRVYLCDGARAFFEAFFMPQVIYSKSAGAAFIDRAYTAVAHHCTSPAFYEEVCLFVFVCTCVGMIHVLYIICVQSEYMTAEGLEVKCPES